MVICFTVNENYRNHLIHMIKNIEQYSMGNCIYYIVYSSLSKESIKKISCLSVKHVFLKVSEDAFRDAPLLRKDFSKEAYYKLLLPYILPKDIAYALYLDLDLLVCGDITKMESCGIEEYCLAAVPDYFVNRKLFEYKNNLGLGDRLYFNSGVMYLNLPKIRKELSLDKIFEYIREHGSEFRFHDQEVWNVFFGRNYLELPETYNYLSAYRTVSDFMISLFSRKKIKIIHYAGFKPWNLFYVGKYYVRYILQNDISDCICLRIKSWKYIGVIPFFFLRNITAYLALNRIPKIFKTLRNKNENNDS